MDSDRNMATTVEVVGGTASPGENEDGFGDDPRLDKKKKKMKPFQKVKNFFRGSSKKRFKPDESGSQKAHSTSALHHGAVGGDDDDDGGFRKSHVLAGSRSISEDSIFKHDTKEPTPGVLENKTVSMENIESNPFQTELFMKLKSRQSDSDIDEGLPYSPLTTTLTPHGLIFDVHVPRKSVPASTGKSTSQESEQSLISVDGSDEDLFSRNWKSGVASVRTARSSSMDSLPENQMDVSDFESVQMTSSSLSNEAAKHRISVKPKSRRLSSKVSMRKRDRSPVPPQLPDVKEESPSKSLNTSDPSSSMPHKTVISTTISVGPSADSGTNVIPRSEPRSIPSKPEVKEMAKSEPRDIVVTRHEGDIERTRPRSLSPLSTSPVSQSMIQEVKLRPRPASGKFDGVDIKKDSPEKPDNELAKAFNRAKRISKKFDEDGNVIDTNVKPVVKAPQKETEKTIDMSKSMDLSRSFDMSKSMDMSKSVTLPKEEPKSSASPSKDTAAPSSVSSPVSGGVSFVLKKEPLRPASKQEATLVRTGSVEAKTGSMEAKETPKVEPAVDTKQAVSETPKSSVNITDDLKKDNTTSSPSKTIKLGSPEKLASPREEYRLKRAARSKTLPVSSEMLEKAEEKEKSPSNSRLGSPPLRSKARNDYDNVSIESKASSIQSKRSSWASSSITTSSTSSEPAWVVRARLKQMEQENKEKEKSDATKEVKVDIKTSNNSTVAKTDTTETDNVSKTNDKTSIEQKTDISKGIVQTSSVKSWAQNYSAKPFEKQTSTVTAKPSAGISSVGNKSSFEKTSVQSVKPVAMTTSDQSSVNKPVVTTSKPTTSLGSKPTFTPASKPTVSNVSKPTVSNFSKPTISAASKPPLASTASNVDKPALQTSKPGGFVSSSNSDKSAPLSSKVSGFGGVSSTSGFSRSFSQKTGSTPVQKASSDNKPVQSVTNKSINVLKSDSKDNVTKPASITSLSKDTKNSDNDNKSLNTGSITSAKPGSSFDKSKISIGNTKQETSSSVPAWKQALNQKKAGSSQVKIEIIDKDSDTKPAQKKMEEKPAQMREKPKTTPEKCSDMSSNRPSKVLDMVKSFQKLQVT